ncbi:MAG TPA: hypothetical protein VFR76_12715 [Verrucomicrobiae bacterium]|nr:hypothetical protein [Verrucomicrobiae bacterium]
MRNIEPAKADLQWFGWFGSGVEGLRHLRTAEQFIRSRQVAALTALDDVLLNTGQIFSRGNGRSCWLSRRIIQAW